MSDRDRTIREQEPPTRSHKSGTWEPRDRNTGAGTEVSGTVNKHIISGDTNPQFENCKTAQDEQSKFINWFTTSSMESGYTPVFANLISFATYFIQTHW
ncbi:hypothetical protein UY3_02499 [Chelonia mydas]|uniref:Uncharacterized protein n=1 Tax=Chelonia mydas TaxID=8469 RepID=M7BR30_CHEMY|nr:hypothetical protein UY3_02499 [Chelonia mydas]